MTTRFDAAEKKLREAHFFVGKIDSARITREPESAEAVDFYLSAFLSAARSVFQVLNNKSGSTKFHPWFTSWFASLPQAEQNTFNAVRDGRDHSLKEGTLPTREGYQAPATSYPPELQFLFDGELPVTPREFLGRISPEDTEQDLVTRCQECIAVMVRLVTEFDQFLGAEPAGHVP